MNEQWKVINGFESYEVSNFGNVRRLKSKRILKPDLNPTGYYVVTLYHTKGKNRKLISRLVASAFHSLSEFIGGEVNHKDGNKLNNHYRNLEWCTRKENIRHAFKTGLIKPNKCEHFMSSVIQLGLDGKKIKTFKSMTEAERATGARNANISKVCIGERNSAGGFKWQYA